jgi:predicted urease superfamily metal-dependent hydrolase
MVFRRTRRGGPRASGSTTSRSFAERSRAQNARYVEISFDIVRALDKRLEIAAVDDLGFSPAEVARLQANAFAVAAMPAAARDAALGEIEALAREIGPGKA